MGLFDWLKGQFIDVIEWLDDSHETLVYRFQRPGNEIKQGAKLIVRPGQVAIFVNEGRIADVLGPGTYELDTRNLPILTSLQHWDHGFESPFKAEVYFVSTTRFTNLKWGTKGEVVIPDPLFGMVPIRAYGSFEIRVVDPVKFLKEVVGTDGLFTTEEIQGQLANLIVSNLPKGIGELGISVRELALHYNRLGESLREFLTPIFEGYGLKLEKLVIENVSLPEKIKGAIEERVSQDILGDMDRYIKYKTAQGLEKGGAGIEGVGAGIGFGLGAEMARNFGRGGGGEERLIDEIRKLREELGERGGGSPSSGGELTVEKGGGESPVSEEKGSNPAEIGGKFAEGTGLERGTFSGEKEGGPEKGSRGGDPTEGVTGGGKPHSPAGTPSGKKEGIPTPPPPPPPPPPPGPFYLAVGGESQGPFSYQQILEMVQRGEVGPESYLWRPGLENWKLAKELLPTLFN
ncbi:MAG: SPFH domain-containing protein [Campylobacterales bacterium]